MLFPINIFLVKVCCVYLQQVGAEGVDKRRRGGAGVLGTRGQRRPWAGCLSFALAPPLREKSQTSGSNFDGLPTLALANSSFWLTLVVLVQKGVQFKTICLPHSSIFIFTYAIPIQIANLITFFCVDERKCKKHQVWTDSCIPEERE